MAKVALITGCSSGFGLLTAVEMARAGFDVVATMRNLEKRSALDAAGKAAGVTLDVRRLDVTDIWEKNVVLGERVNSPDSPNYERIQRFVQFVQKEVPKRDAREVARLIVKIAQNPNPRLRYIAGADAHMGYWTKRLLPWKTWEKMVARYTKID